MQRHISDTAYLPQRPSRLNPNNTNSRPSRGLPVGVTQRGTMSMPTSPILGKISSADAGLWNSPHTAEATSSLQIQQESSLQTVATQRPENPSYLTSNVSLDLSDHKDLPHTTQFLVMHLQSTPPISAYDAQLENMNSPISSQELLSAQLQYHSPPIHSAIDGGETNLNCPVSAYHISHTINTSSFAPQLQSGGVRSEHRDDLFLRGPDDHFKTGSHECGVDIDMDLGPGGRRKRAQVRIACTHCQKACKKCSNTRPCERCVKYGLNDCIDSTRKPRKTGTKRGPYKRRSSKYSAIGSHPYSSHSVPQPHLVQRNENNHRSELNHTHTSHFHLTNENSHGNMNIDAQSSSNHMNQANPDFHQDVVLMTNPNLTYESHSTNPQQITYPPFPKAQTSLVQAISSALSSPQSHWINGQRLPPNMQTKSGNLKTRPSPLYPKTPNGPFPISLTGKGDPFSRAVSPIRQFAQLPTLVSDLDGLSEENEDLEVALTQEGNGAREQLDPNHVSNGSDILKTSYRDGHDPSRYNADINNHLSEGDHVDGIQREKEVESHTPFDIPSKIRKPSLRTLMLDSASTSRATSPVPGTHTKHPDRFDSNGIAGNGNRGVTNNNGTIESPTLFDGVSMVDEVNLHLEHWAGWDHMNHQKALLETTNGQTNIEEGRVIGEGNNSIGEGLFGDMMMGLH
ncbi:uncharacterized protein IL334_001403 [Kwoniella shivajii]|uniref:Zn(2)-C6 fungal-type domain-containing protein n=1 Tax=Kwoniella shivajii TaxID=564305 RepID=A0ABZ1CS35_9TREE|nr:hypothetical protein IL334_001403 [Kwoniella shivajii]